MEQSITNCTAAKLQLWFNRGSSYLQDVPLHALPRTLIYLRPVLISTGKENPPVNQTQDFPNQVQFSAEYSPRSWYVVIKCNLTTWFWLFCCRGCDGRYGLTKDITENPTHRFRRACLWLFVFILACLEHQFVDTVIGKFGHLDLAHFIGSWRRGSWSVDLFRIFES